MTFFYPSNFLVDNMIDSDYWNTYCNLEVVTAVQIDCFCDGCTNEFLIGDSSGW